MDFKLKRNVTAIAVVATAAFAGGAYAATQASQTSPRQAFLNDAAKRLKVTPQQLNEAFRGAFFDQLDAAVAAGKLTKAQADKIKQRAQTGAGLPFGGPRLGLHGLAHGFALRPPGLGQAGPGHGGRLDAAATYLGLTPQNLFKQLAGGKSLAQIASARGKSVSGLKAAMLAAIHARLDKAVSAKLITAAQEQQMLTRVPARLDAEISRAGFRFPHRGFRFHGLNGGSGMGPGGPAGRPGWAPGAPKGVPMPPPPGPAGFAPPPPGAPGPAYWS
jgi:hypothetical protein